MDIQMPPPETMESLLARTMGDKQIIALYVRRMCTLHKDAAVEKEVLHADYAAWMAERGREPRPLRSFGHHLLNLPLSISVQRRRVEGRGRVWFYVGIAPIEF